MDIDIETDKVFAAGYVGKINNRTFSISRCTVGGTIKTSAMDAAGFVAETSGVCNITDCLSGLTIVSSVNGDGTHGGFVGVQNRASNDITMKGCVFNGKLLGADTNSCGGFIGSKKKNITISDSIFAPEEVTVGNDNSAMLVPNGATAVSNSYYLYALGGDTDDGTQGKHGYSVTAGENVSFVPAGDAAQYEVSGITAYENNSCLQYNGTFYAGSEDEVSLILEHPAVPTDYTFSGYTASAGTLNDGVLTMPAENVTISGKFEFIDGIGARLVGRSITVEDDVSVNFYMELSDEIAQSETAYMQFTIPTGDKTETETVLVSDALQQDGCYRFNCNVAAKEMTSDIKAQVIDPESGRQGTVYTYSIKNYADTLLAHTKDNWSYRKAAPLVKTMLNYGAAAQIYFDKTSTGLANAGLSDEDKTLGEITDQLNPWENYTGENLSDVPFIGATLSLKSQTTLSLYFTDTDELTFTCVDEKGKERIVKPVRNGETQIARIRDIAAAELQYSYTVTVKKGDTELGSITYSPMNYCHKALNGGTQNVNLQTVAKALYWYSKEAHEYFYQNIVDLGSLPGSYEAKSGDVLTGRLEGSKKITVAAGAAVTLRDADITGLGNKELAGITLLGDANVLIEGTNAVKGGCEDYPGILVPENHTLTIDGGGSLDVFSKGSSAIGGIYNFDTPGGSGNIVIKGSTITAVGGAYCAAIGSTCFKSCGTITISGGTVNATSGFTGAGIGSGGAGSCAGIIITGGTVNAKGGENDGITSAGGAGIGSGGEGRCADIIITGGQVTAVGGQYAAGIGSGSKGEEYAASCDNITISGGTINATGGEYGAGIGCGAESSCADITITGGTVTAAGGEDAAGIGSGVEGSCSDIVISGGEVTATGGKNGAGIGSGGTYGDGARCGDITITKDVIHVTAIKGENAQAIGNGYNGICGTITIEEGANVTRDE